MTDATRDPAPGDPGALIDRLGVIEGQALEERAAAYAQLHDELQTALEGGERSA